MNTNQYSPWLKVGFSIVITCLFSILVYMAFIVLPIGTATAASNLSDQGDEDPIVLDDTDVYTIFLPIVLKPSCGYHLSRPPLQGTANFAGEVEIQTPADCTTGLPAETPVTASGTYTGTPDKATLWVLAYAPNTLYYPQSPNASQGEPPFQSDEYWQVPAYLGLRGGNPEWFDLVVVLVDEGTNQFLSNLVRQGYQTGTFTGVPAAQFNQMAITEKGFISVQTVD